MEKPTSFIQCFFRFILLFLLFCFSVNAFAQQRQQAKTFGKQAWSLEENKGQLADENGNVLTDIKFYGRDNGVSVYLKKDKISFVFTKVEDQGEISESSGKPRSVFPYNTMRKML